MDTEVIQESIQKIAAELSDALHDQWPEPERIVLVKKQLGLVAQIFVDYFFQNGESRWGNTNTSTRQIENDLHDACYIPGTGSWFTATITVHNDGRVETDFDYESDPRATEPKMEIPLTPEALRREVELFPRDFANWPHWFRDKATEFGIELAND